MRFVLRVAATAVAVAVAAFFVPGIVVTGTSTEAKVLILVVVGLVIGALNTFVKPVLTFLTGCLILLTFGLFLVVINAWILMAASWIAQNLGFGFHVAGFWPAVLGSIVISLVSGLMNGVLGTDREQ